ncbi:MAG TPA: DUF493 domain-containing protein, partial [Anaerolineae bacterium]
MTDIQQLGLQFPCSFPLKAVGYNDDDFEALIVSIVRRHVPLLDEGAVTSRTSNGGKYLSVTATFIADSRAQL